MKGNNDDEQPCGAPYLLKQVEEPAPAYHVECFRMVNKRAVERHLLLSALLLEGLLFYLFFFIYTVFKQGHLFS